MNQTLFKQALNKFNEKKFEESKLLFEKILISEPKNFRAMQALGLFMEYLKIILLLYRFLEKQYL